MLTAPPFTLTVAGSRPNFLMFAKATTLKASLISHREMSETLRFDCCRSFGTASEGAMVKSMGAVAASAKPDTVDD